MMLSIAAKRIAFSSTRVGCWDARTSEAPVNKASSPRPRPNFCLATSHYLLGQRTIGQSSWRGGIIIEHGVTKTGGFAQANIAINNRMKRLFPEEVAYFAHNLTGQACTRIRHRSYSSRAVA